MESNPPSYGQATTVNAWDLIADYIPSSDLCSAALVCQQWHAVFAPHLWGNPASHFGHENDRVYGESLRTPEVPPQPGHGSVDSYMPI
ncbi:hypothetical protein KCU89_g1294, partial [Aureobasidium melanogenum]